MTDQTVAPPPPKGDRIAKLLARAGIASRREIERMIAEGRIALDGTVLETPATILASLRGVTVDGQPVAAAEAARLFLYHKPTGLLVTERDPAGRPTIYDRLPADLPRTVPVGRLDLNTEGLLLLTTDGGLKRELELPATGVERTYRARAYGDVTQAMLEDLIEGVEIEGVRYGSIDANLERRTGANVWIEMTLTEGKNREVRRVLEHLGLQVGRLIRTRYGPFVLGDLPPGEVGEVKQHDLVAFARTLGGKRRAKGADLQSLVSVETRVRAAKVVAPPPAEPAPLRRAPPARATSAWPAPARSGGWGSRTRPSRPAEASDPRPGRGTFRAADDTASRSAERRPGFAAGGRVVRAAPLADPRAARPGRNDGDPRKAHMDERPARGDDRPHVARPPRAGTGQHSRPAERDDRPRRGAGDHEQRPVRSGKGPAGGRGHPPRAPRPDGKRPPKGPPKGKR